MCVFIGWKQRLTCCIGVDGRRTWLSSHVLTLDQFLSSLLDIGHFLGFPKVRSWAHNFFSFFFSATLATFCTQIKIASNSRSCMLWIDC